MFKNLIRKARKGFSLVELVVVILIIAILAVAVFAGGSAVIKKSQVSRTTSDLHNFSIAVEAAMNETPSIANMDTESQFDAIYNAVKKNLSADYQLKDAQAINPAGNIVLTAGTADSGNYAIYESQKTDAWGNPYYVIFDATERHAKGISEFYITVVSAGPNAQTTITNSDTANDGKGIEADDVFLLVQYTDGDVAAVIYNVDDSETKLENGADQTASTPVAAKELGVTVKGVAATTNQGQYIGTEINDSGLASLCPVNFQPVA